MDEEYQKMKGFEFCGFFPHLSMIRWIPFLIKTSIFWISSFVECSVFALDHLTEILRIHNSNPNQSQAAFRLNFWLFNKLKIPHIYSFTRKIKSSELNNYKYLTKNFGYLLAYSIFEIEFLIYFELMFFGFPVHLKIHLKIF